MTDCDVDVKAEISPFLPKMLLCMAFITAIETLRQMHKLSSVPLQRVLSKIFPKGRLKF